MIVASLVWGSPEWLGGARTVYGQIGGAIS